MKVESRPPTCTLEGTTEAVDAFVRELERVGQDYQRTGNRVAWRAQLYARTGQPGKRIGFSIRGVKLSGLVFP